ncbi:hypothetical protein [Winogradskya humida]|uniref:Uncharacterized protein n=1 Tax=Winogradskya humida TaxID=113566 RepID=A0ABQ3ZLR1_9ACTN|nr:hypothetical protein [Actinoplanes humidus]GIE19518.1 hypothetical protein Ahu01nite_026200 [Actinoplanes humidus]
MDTSSLPEPLRARMEQQAARSTWETVRDFIEGFVADTSGLDEVRTGLQQTADYSTRSLHTALAAIDAILVEPQPEGTLLRLVAGHGGWDLDHDPTDAGAAVFLHELAGMVRAVIEQTESR